MESPPIVFWNAIQFFDESDVLLEQSIQEETNTIATLILMHANHDQIDIVFTKAFNDLETIDALPEDLICSVMAKLQVLDQQFMELFLEAFELVLTFVTSNSP